jgi:hypothetical protein
MAAYPSSASVRRTPLVKRNYCLRSHLRGLVFTLNHIAVIEDSAIVCAHDSDRHHENHHWRRRRRPHPRRWGWGRPRRRWRWRPLRPKTAFPLRLRPFGPRGGIVGRSARAALIPRRYLRLKRATREPGFHGHRVRLGGVGAHAEGGLPCLGETPTGIRAPQPKTVRQTQFGHSNRLERSLFDVLADNQCGPGGHFPPHPGQMGQRLRNHHPGIITEVHQPLVVGVEHAH